MPLWMALAKSLNTVAAELSFAVGREKVIEMTRRLGITGVKKTCSMALGDYGITPLRAHRRHRHLRQRRQAGQPYAILELVNSKGDLVYCARARRAGSAAGRRAQGRRGDEPDDAEGRHRGHRPARGSSTSPTSPARPAPATGPKDVWFVGFTGKYVGDGLARQRRQPPDVAAAPPAAVFAAPVWHAFMSVAHTDMNIPTIPGLQPHPVQVAEQQRIAAIEAEGATDAPEAPAHRSSSLMSDKTREPEGRRRRCARPAVSPSRRADAPTSPAPARRSPAAAGHGAQAAPPARAQRSAHDPARRTAARGTLRRAVP